ncbi:autoinducer binding domain-containing protein [Paraburkholderia sediminicola]|uniref:autoinducer binding domain-containing protein n=1 Tax=Paraburkholderia sediminicola TaxID=458836 RepID=UPI0038BB68CF
MNVIFTILPVEFSVCETPDSGELSTTGRERISRTSGGVSRLFEPSAFRDSATWTAAVHAAVRRIGFDTLCYWRVRLVGKRLTHVVWYSMCSPRGWATHYERERLYEIDPCLAAACHYDWPNVWDLDSIFRTQAGSWSAAQRHRYLSSASSFGIGSGVTFGLVGRDPFERAVVSLSSTRMNRAWIVDTAVGSAYALATAVDAHIKPCVGECLPRHAGGDLSAVHAKLLRFITDGLSRQQMATLLNLSADTVGYHLSRLEQVYGASNRTQLAYMAGRTALTCAP